MVEIDFGEMRADVLGIAVVDVLPGGLHAGDFGARIFVELAEEGVLKFGGGGTRKHAGYVHVGVAGAGETEIDYADDFVVFVEQDVAEIEVAVDELVGFGVFDVAVIGVDVFFVMFVVEFFKEFAERIFDFLGGGAKVDVGKFFDEFGDVVSGAGESGVRKVVDAVTQGVAVNFFVHREGAALVVVMELHVRGVETGFAFDEIADGSVFDDHFGPERIAGKTEKVGFLIGGDFDDNVGPASENMVGFENLALGESLRDDAIERVVRCEKFSHGAIISHLGVGWLPKGKKYGII